jgi:hypothetical protein
MLIILALAAVVAEYDEHDPIIDVPLPVIAVVVVRLSIITLLVVETQMEIMSHQQHHRQRRRSNRLGQVDLASSQSIKPWVEK